MKNLPNCCRFFCDFWGELRTEEVFPLYSLDGYNPWNLGFSRSVISRMKWHASDELMLSFYFSLTLKNDRYPVLPSDPLHHEGNEHNTSCKTTIIIHIIRIETFLVDFQPFLLLHLDVRKWQSGKIEISWGTKKAAKKACWQKVEICLPLIYLVMLFLLSLWQQLWASSDDKRRSLCATFDDGNGMFSAAIMPTFFPPTFPHPRLKDGPERG